MDLVVKDNTLMCSSYSLSLVEQRVILLSIVNAREENLIITPDTFIIITAESYANIFQVNIKNVYTMLLDASRNLYKREVSLDVIDKDTNQPVKLLTRWVTAVSYIEGQGSIQLRFSREIIPLISRLEKRFTSYELSEVRFLKEYSTRLYELVISWKEAKKTPMFEFNEFKRMIGVLDGEYPLMHNFKNRVLNPAINDINKYTNINIEITQHKNGRTIVGFSFTVKEKNTKKNKEINQQATAITMTDSQRKFFASKLSRNASMSTYAKEGEEYDDFVVRLEKLLEDPKNIKRFQPQLIQEGFVGK